MKEWAYLDQEAKGALLSFLANHDSMADTLILRTPADDRLAFYLQDPRIKQEVWPYFMARIVDAPAFIGMYPFIGQEQGVHCRIKLTDGKAPWNDGVFVWSIDPSGTGRLERTEGTYELECSIQTMTAMLFGYMRPRALYADGRIKGEVESVGSLEAAIPETPTYLMDFF